MKLRPVTKIVLPTLMVVGLGLTGLALGRGGQPVPPNTQRVTAVHEAAHIVIGCAVDPKYRVVQLDVAVVLTASRKTLGYTHSLKNSPANDQQRQDRAAMLMAGDEAERSLLGSDSYADTEDQQRARLACRPPCSSDPENQCDLPANAEEAEQIRRRTETCLVNGELLAQRLVIENGLAIIRLTEAIMAQPPGFFSRSRHLDGTEIHKLLEGAGLRCQP